MHVYEIRPRKDHRRVDLISDVLQFGRLWYGEPNASDFVIKKLPPHTPTMCRAAVLPQNTIVLNQRPADWQSGNTSDLCIGKSLMLPSRPI